MKRLIGLVGLILLIVVATSEAAHIEGLPLDLPAALLVIVAPYFCLMMFSPTKIAFGQLLSRFRQFNRSQEEELSEEMLRLSSTSGKAAEAAAVMWADGHDDEMVEFGGQLLASKYSKEDVEELMWQRIKTEDSKWMQLSERVGFLAKMSPYFGMAATVLGMIRVLSQVDDFSRISSHIGMALYGTLYGVCMFALIYGPLQSSINQVRIAIGRRNETIMRWYIRVLEKRDSFFIQGEMGLKESALITPNQPESAT